jgi:outer membrane protein assembly factor BamC
VYYVRYVDPALAGQEEPGFLKRLFSFGRARSDDAGPKRYRVQVKGDGARSTVTVLDAQGQPETGDAGKRIASLLLDDLR